MQQTLIAVFDNRNDAQEAMNELLGSGFDRTNVLLSDDSTNLSGTAGSSSTAGGTADAGTGFFMNFFQTMFGGATEPHAQKYSSAITHGNYVLTVTATDESDVERAADIVERFGPIDIDEKAAAWGEGASASSSEAMRMGSAGSLQGTQSAASMQRQQSGSDLADARGNIQGGNRSGSQQREAESTAIPVVREELKIGKREVQRGGVRVFSRIVETPVNESVNLREEHVNVQRRTVDQPLSDADTAAFKEQTIELRETNEEAVVQKSARVVEEVLVGRQVTQRQQGIKDTVRHTEVEVEQLEADSPEDEAAWRSHWTSNYGTKGGDYEDYAPAYTYGSQMAGQYRGRQWNEVESDLRSNWESRNASGGASTWEQFKAAIRHGWDRMTS